MADDWQPQSNIVILIYGEKLEINFSLFLHNIYLVLRTEEALSYFLASRWFFQSLRFVKAAEPSGKRHPSGCRALRREEKEALISYFL